MVVEVHGARHERASRGPDDPVLRVGFGRTLAAEVLDDRLEKRPVAGDVARREESEIGAAEAEETAVFEDAVDLAQEALDPIDPYVLDQVLGIDDAEAAVGKRKAPVGVQEQVGVQPARDEPCAAPEVEFADGMPGEVPTTCQRSREDPDEREVSHHRGRVLPGSSPVCTRARWPGCRRRSPAWLGGRGNSLLTAP